MWLPAFLAKPADTTQEYASLQPPFKWGYSFYWIFGLPDIANDDPVWPSVHQREHLLSSLVPLHDPCHHSGLAERSGQESE